MMSRVATRAQHDDRSFDIEFWRMVGPAGRLAAAWHMIAEVQLMRGQGGELPRMDRSVTRVLRRSNVRSESASELAHSKGFAFQPPGSRRQRTETVGYREQVRRFMGDDGSLLISSSSNGRDRPPEACVGIVARGLEARPRSCRAQFYGLVFRGKSNNITGQTGG
jgi:hypothetical protein